MREKGRGAPKSIAACDPCTSTVLPSTDQFLALPLRATRLFHPPSVDPRRASGALEVEMEEEEEEALVVLEMESVVVIVVVIIALASDSVLAGEVLARYMTPLGSPTP